MLFKNKTRVHIRVYAKDLRVEQKLKSIDPKDYAISAPRKGSTRVLNYDSSNMMMDVLSDEAASSSVRNSRFMIEEFYIRMTALGFRQTPR
ncbi:hypothetical protein NPIL_648671 [Nephila pilipes]|uniref:Uncharacterized protein n=1 Tax=Nephila pilipes TaxID=299642 RepID=A0A8X6QC70_NEPPI|nr:hypothetical protein NPIL_648671 [Nephila pilipes]